MKNKSYIGISFIILIFGIWAVPKIVAKFQKSDLAEIGQVAAQDVELVHAPVFMHDAALAFAQCGRHLVLDIDNQPGVLAQLGEGALELGGAIAALGGQAVVDLGGTGRVDTVHPRTQLAIVGVLHQRSVGGRVQRELAAVFAIGFGGGDQSA